ncbi:6-cysteine protein [Plasmodium sp. gorilla clade G3]|nr:6-cysteine protein [Plasmodium sp. gorilla clade G3]
MIKLYKKNCLGISFVLYFLLSVCEGNNNLTCDFNNVHKLDFHDHQKTNVTRICSLNPKVLDKVTIKCGSDKLNYNLYPVNCFEEVYTSINKVHLKKLTEYVTGSSMIMKSSLTTNKYKEVSFRVPPNTMPEKPIYCFCENRKKINNIGSSGKSQGTQEIVNRGVAEIVIPSLTEKIKGCDFTTKESAIFTKGYNINDTIYSRNTKQDIICTINAHANDLIGFKCPSNYSIEPHDCFVSAFNLKGENENLENKLKFADLIMDHYNNTFYSRLSSLISDNVVFFCTCSKENEKKLVFIVEAGISSSTTNLPSTDDPYTDYMSSSSFLTFSSYYALIIFVITSFLSFIL